MIKKRSCGVISSVSPASTGVEPEVVAPAVAVIVFASAFGQYRVIRKRLSEGDRPPDAVIVEPATLANLDLILSDLRGRTGAVMLNAWDPAFETHMKEWPGAFPIGTVSMNHTKIGELQGRQVSSVVGQGASILVVTGPSRSSAAVERLQGLKSTVRPDIHVFDAEARQHVASINHAFEPPAPPFDDEGQTFLDPINPQSELSDALLGLFRIHPLNDRTSSGLV